MQDGFISSAGHRYSSSICRLDMRTNTGEYLRCTQYSRNGCQVKCRSLLIILFVERFILDRFHNRTDYKCMSVPCCCMPGSPMFLRALRCMARTTSPCPCHAAACRAVQCSFGFSDAWHGLQVHVRAILLHAGQSNVPPGSPMHGTDYKSMSVPCCCMPGSPMFLRVLQCLGL